LPKDRTAAAGAGRAGNPTASDHRARRGRQAPGPPRLGRPHPTTPHRPRSHDRAQQQERRAQLFVAETAIATTALSLCKQPYLLVAALLLVPAWKHRREIGWAIGAALAASAAFALAWAHWANAHYLAPDFLPPFLGGHPNYANVDVQPSAQIRYLRSHPFALARAIGRMVTDHGVSIAHDVFVQTSYWHVPGIVAVLTVCGLVAAVAFDAGRLPGGAAMRVLGWAVVVVIVCVSLLLAYVGWNALRAPRIDGYQGRYLFVVVAIAALVAAPDGWRRMRGSEPRRDGSAAAASRARGAVVAALAGWSAALLALVELGLAWHAYR